MLESAGCGDRASKICLDLGCGSGIIAAHLAPLFAQLVACDADETAVAFAHSSFHADNLALVVADAAHVPLADKSCDVIICAHVYEHVVSAESLVAEIRRLLRPGGRCFFAGPNARALYEPHLKLWLVHWLPRSLVNGLLRMVGRSAYLEHLRTRGELLRLLSGFEVKDFTLELVRDPVRFHTSDEPGLAIARRLPRALLVPLLHLFAPSFNFVLRKPGG